MTRACPYCSARNHLEFGYRRSQRFLECEACHSVFPDLDVAEFSSIHDRAFDDDGFVQMQLAALGNEPDRSGWSWARRFLPGRRVLEIGPGAGHLLAAAKADGCEVACTESSVVHRAYIRGQWGIEDVYESLGELPPERRFDSVIMINVIEHVYDVAALLRALRAHLDEGGKVLVSTCNAAALLPRFVGVWWTMFKPEDHVSIPSAAGLRLAAARSGLRAEQVWTDELPLESLIGVAAASRDYLLEHSSRASQRPATPAPTNQGGRTIEPVPLRRRITWATTRLAGSVIPFNGLLKSVGLAASLKAVLTTDDSGGVGAGQEGAQA